VIVQLYERKDLSKFFNTDKRMWKINECFNATSKNPKAKELLKDIFIYLGKCSLLTCDDSLIHAVYNSVQFRDNWLNNIFKWKPAAKQAAFQFMELAHYLFCQYKVPEFLYKA